MRILAIETSCDETSIALVECGGGIRAPKFQVIKNIVSSQIAVHAPFGGVVPNLAKREHLKNLPKILRNLQLITNNASNKAKSAFAGQLKDIDAIAVTVGPGLEPALWTGIEFAKELQRKINGSPSTSLRASKRRVALLGANHMEGHLYSNWLTKSTNNNKQLTKLEIKFPAIALVVSGGHTILLAMESVTKWKKLGETRDDAVGEAFDKVARMLSLPYPGGPSIQKLAAQGNCDAIDFPQPMKNEKNYDFSYSGLKTSVLYYLRDNPKANKADVAASFERAATDVLVYKTKRAAIEFGAKSILLSGGVAANKLLRKKLSVLSRELGVQFFVPPFEYNTDNAAMIAAAAYIGHLKKKKYRMVANGNLSL